MDLFWAKDPSGESNKDHCRNFLNFHPRAVIEGIKVAKSNPFRDHNIAQNSGFKPKYFSLCLEIRKIVRSPRVEAAVMVDLRREGRRRRGSKGPAPTMTMRKNESMIIHVKEEKG